MQKKSGASLRCLQSRTLSSNVQASKTSVEDFEVKDEANAQTGGGAVENNSTFTSNSFAPTYESYQGPMYQQDICMFSTFSPDIQSVQLNQLNGFDSQMYYMNNTYSLPVENQYQYVPVGMVYQGYPYELQFQEFQYFVVIDFEATCDKENNPHPQEIIEFPSVLVNSMTGQLEASFQTYVRPAYHQHLTDFCKELTGIQQIQVDRGVPLSEALLMHDKWLEEKGIKHTNFAVVTWSNWDCRVMLESECRFKKIRKPPYFNRWINLRVPFNKVFGGVRCNLKEAVQLAGLAWEGRAHCGLDDARNTARLLSYLMHRGFRFSITNSLPFLTDQSILLQQSSDCSLNSAQYPHQLKSPSSMSVAQSLPARVDFAKECQSPVSVGLKVANALPKRQVPYKVESSSVVATGLPQGTAYINTSSGWLLQSTRTTNLS
ncbi:Eri1 exoribonuclease [Thalictrum thalictroides]|uniref:Eri1 exoribonuclease n=1 Tax=Thalictrum thalictroides TaxID=46969 RepID=A0A7J6VNB1_THATH|nr:Eri1 exoribonuclease [Thalictrum thalictroides]